MERRGFVWSLSKTLPVDLSGIPKNALHVHMGLITFFGLVISREWLSSGKACVILSAIGSRSKTGHYPNLRVIS